MDVIDGHTRFEVPCRLGLSRSRWPRQMLGGRPYSLFSRGAPGRDSRFLCKCLSQDRLLGQLTGERAWISRSSGARLDSLYFRIRALVLEG